MGICYWKRACNRCYQNPLNPSLAEYCENNPILFHRLDIIIISQLKSAVDMFNWNMLFHVSFLRLCYCVKLSSVAKFDTFLYHPPYVETIIKLQLAVSCLPTKIMLSMQIWLCVKHVSSLPCFSSPPLVFYNSTRYKIQLLDIR